MRTQKTGWLIYNQEGANRNAWFIKRLQDEMQKNGVSLSLVVADTPLQLPNNTPDFAIVRAMNADINAEMEKRGVRTVNNAQTAFVAGDKWQTYLLCKQLNIPVLPTVLGSEQTVKTFLYPCVVKSRFGHGGREVFWAENQQQALQIVQDNPEKYILQTPCDSVGCDTRVYAVGEQIAACVKRTSKSDFRSNFSLGGNAELVAITSKQKAIVERLQAYLGFDFIGVDFLPHANGVVLNELEDAAGTRMLYANGIDIVPIYAKQILKRLCHIT